jgi:hypothetical protein
MYNKKEELKQNKFKNIISELYYKTKKKKKNAVIDLKQPTKNFLNIYKNQKIQSIQNIQKKYI